MAITEDDLVVKFPHGLKRKELDNTKASSLQDFLFFCWLLVAITSSFYKIQKMNMSEASMQKLEEYVI